MSKRAYLALKLYDGETNAGKVELPHDRLGIMFVFKTKTAARKFCGKNVTIREMQILNHQMAESGAK